jgi:hypothetical protein
MEKSSRRELSAPGVAPRTQTGTVGEVILAMVLVPEPVTNGAVPLRHGVIDSIWLRWLAQLDERLHSNRR